MKKITLIKGKRRFRTDDEILAKIDQCHTRAKGYQEQTEIKETQALDILRGCLGNSIVPQVAQIFAQFIYQQLTQ